MTPSYYREWVTLLTPTGPGPRFQRVAISDPRRAELVRECLGRGGTFEHVWEFHEVTDREPVARVGRNQQ